MAEREGRRRRCELSEERAGAELEVQLLRANAQAQAFFVARNGAGEGIGTALEAKVAAHKAEVALLEIMLKAAVKGGSACSRAAE